MIVSNNVLHNMYPQQILSMVKDLFNSLSQGLKQPVDVATFKRDLKTYLFKKNELGLEFNPRRSKAISGIR